MRRDDLTDLSVFLAVAEERSFTRAAARLGVTQPTLSHTIRRFEERLGIRLLTRSTRNVAPTEAGERLLRAAAPRFKEIQDELDAMGELRDKPSGLVRVTSDARAYHTLIWPALKLLVPAYPDVTFEITIENRLTDIVAERFDAGVRLGESLDQDMIAVKIGPEERYIVVGAPSYFSTRSMPVMPQDLMQHACIGLRHNSAGRLYAWEFEKDGRKLNVQVRGPLVFNSAEPAFGAARVGAGLAYVPESEATPYLETGELVQVLDDWSQPFPGYYLYYPSRRQLTPAFMLLVDALRGRTDRSEVEEQP